MVKLRELLLYKACYKNSWLCFAHSPCLHSGNELCKFQVCRLWFSICKCCRMTTATHPVTVHHRAADPLHSCCLSPNPVRLWQPQDHFFAFIYLFLFCLFIFIFCKIPHASEIIQFLSFSTWLTLLSVKSLRFIYIIANDRILFFYGWVIFSCVCCTYIYIHTYTYLQ